MKIDDAVNALGSLAQPARLKVFRLLVKLGDEGMSAGEISSKLQIAKSTLSFHLKELVHADLIESQRRGRTITYRLKPRGMQQLMTFLTEDCCQGRPDLCLPEACQGKHPD